MIGGVTRGECVWWFNQAKALLHPVKEFREPLGLAPLECQACNTPCISWRNGAMSETIVDGETGVLVDSEEELLAAVKYAANQPVTKEMEQACRANAEKFSIGRMCEKYEELALESLKGGW